METDGYLWFWFFTARILESDVQWWTWSSINRYIEVFKNNADLKTQEMEIPVTTRDERGEDLIAH